MTLSEARERPVPMEASHDQRPHAGGGWAMRGKTTLEGYCTRCRRMTLTYRERHWHLRTHGRSMVYGDAAIREWRKANPRPLAQAVRQ